jgi:hypothetical protein
LLGRKARGSDYHFDPVRTTGGEMGQRSFGAGKIDQYIASAKPGSQIISNMNIPWGSY